MGTFYDEGSELKAWEKRKTSSLRVLYLHYYFEGKFEASAINPSYSTGAATL